MKDFIVKFTAGPVRHKLEGLCLIFILLCGILSLGSTMRFDGKLTFEKEKITYKGQVKNHVMDGKGTLKFENGDQYKGGFSKGVINGFGIYKSTMGWAFEGEFKDGKPNGQGNVIIDDKNKFQGNFENGVYKQ